MNHQEVRQLCEKQGLQVGSQAGSVVPQEDASYIFNKDHVIEVVGFLLMEETAMKLIGPAGCGKTKLIEQFHAAMRWPLLQPPVHSRTEMSDLTGQMLPTEDGALKYVYGHLVNAARFGCSVFLDEYNVLDSSVTTSLNPILEGGKFDIPETGETIMPQPGFRVFVAENPNDKELGFFGRNEEDVSNRERFWTVNLGYPSAEQEEALVMNVLQDAFADDETARTFAKKMVEVATNVRSRYMGDNDAADALEVTMSTRTLTKWATGVVIFSSKPDPFVFALERALTNSAPPETGQAIVELVTDTFGSQAG